MKTEPILEETYRIKEALAAKAGNSIHTLCAQITQNMDGHPPVEKEVHSAEELAALVAREEPTRLAAIPPECLQIYRLHDPIIAEIHRIRAKLAREHNTSGLILHDKPPNKD